MAEMSAAEAAEVIDNETKCVKSDCNRDCAKCKLVLPEDIIISALRISSSVLRKLDTGEIAEVVHAEWVWSGDNDHYAGHCSNCGQKYPVSINSADKYCPSCGSKMDGQLKGQEVKPMRPGAGATIFGEDGGGGNG